MRAVPGSAPLGSPGSPRPPAALRTFDHVAIDGGAELLARALVEVLAVDDPHLLQEGGLAALARTQQQDLHQPLHVGLLPRQAFVDLLGLALLLGLAVRQHAAREAHGQHGARRQEVRHLAAAAASAGPCGSSTSSSGSEWLRQGGWRAGSAAAARARPGREGGNPRTDSPGRAARAGGGWEGGREGGRGGPREGRRPSGHARARCPPAARTQARRAGEAAAGGARAESGGARGHVGRAGRAPAGPEFLFPFSAPASRIPEASNPIPTPFSLPAPSLNSSHCPFRTYSPAACGHL